jgi:anti-anti-sigma regulatory factor
MELEPLIIDLRGSDLDSRDCDRFEQTHRPAFDHPNIIIAMTGVPSMDASCLDSFAAMQKAPKAVSGYSRPG